LSFPDDILGSQRESEGSKECGPSEIFQGKPIAGVEARVGGAARGAVAVAGAVGMVPNGLIKKDKEPQVNLTSSPIPQMNPHYHDHDHENHILAQQGPPGFGSLS